MKGRMPFAVFAVLIFLIVLLPVVLILLNLPGIVTWVSKTSAFFGGNTLMLVALIPVVCGLLLFGGMVIITKKEEKLILADHERMKKSCEFSGEKELQDISTLIDAVKGSLDHIQRSSQEILSLSKKITQISRQFTPPVAGDAAAIPNENSDLKKLPPPLFPLICPEYTDTLPEIPRTPEDRLFKADPGKEVWYMLFKQLKIEQEFNIFIEGYKGSF
ncbi:hypothetical protein LQZ21_12230 [Treponema sp. TIM-1]|uniref:hypothetical protein n=1 Tax=Treponema sp. TIM-1 TaxID=2898417 RepID=UPI0039811333